MKFQCRLKNILYFLTCVQFKMNVRGSKKPCLAIRVKLTHPFIINITDLYFKLVSQWFCSVGHIRYYTTYITPYKSRIIRPLPYPIGTLPYPIIRHEKYPENGGG